MLAVENVNHHYKISRKKVTAITNIDFKVNKGSSLALVGPSGSGKSTLLHCIAGLLTPQSGHITIHDTVLSKLKEPAKTKFRQQHIGMIFQQFHLLQHLSVYENVALPLEFAPSSPKKHQLVREALQTVDLWDRKDHTPAQISGGQAQRVAIARAIVNKPSLILADEPTGELDPENAQLVINLLKKLQQEHSTTIITVTHDPIVAKYMDHTIKLKKGKITNHSSA